MKHLAHYALCSLLALPHLLTDHSPLRPLPAQQPLAPGHDVYNKTLPATVWIVVQTPRGTAFGSGALIDQTRRLVVTNHHVIEDAKTIVVFFPAFDRNNKAIPERQFYLKRRNDLALPAQLVTTDPTADLALLRLPHLPLQAKALPLAHDSPAPGQTVHSIGNPAASDALWVYTSGKVRQVYQRQWQAAASGARTRRYSAKIIETDSPINPGDSGGPLVNDQAQLVGITSAAATQARLFSIFIDVSHLQRLLLDPQVRKIPPDSSPHTPPRRQPLPSADNGHFFQPDTWKQLHNAAATLFQQHIDLVVETYNQPPLDHADQLATLTPAERIAKLRHYAQQRIAQLRLHNGLYVLITRQPPSLIVERHGHIPQWPDNFTNKLSQQLLEDFRKREFDSGLQKFLQTVLEHSPKP
jgi:hypothetical protein